MARPLRRRRVEARVRDVGGPVVAAVDRDLGDRPLGQVALVEPRPRRVVARLCVRAEEHPTVLGTGVDGVAASEADRREEAAACPVRSRPRAARRQIRADVVPVDVSGTRCPRVVRAIEPVRAEEELARLVLVHRERDVEGRPVGQVDPVRDRVVVEEERSAVGHPVRRDAEVRAVDEAVRARAPNSTEAGRRGGVRRRVDEHLSAVAARDVEPRCRAQPDLRNVPLSCVPPQKRAGTVRYGGDRRELAICSPVRWVTTAVSGSDRSVQALPVDRAERICRVQPAAAVEAVPDAAVGSVHDPVRVVRVEGEGLVVRVLVVAEVPPGQAAVVRAEHSAGTDAVVELTAGVDHVRVVRSGLDDVVVEALAAAVVLDVVRARRRCARRKHRPADPVVLGLEDARRVVPGVVLPVEAGVENCA